MKNVYYHIGKNKVWEQPFMTTTKQRLNNKIEQQAIGCRDEGVVDTVVSAHWHGSMFLAPLLLEVVEALKLHDSACRGANIDVKNLKKITENAINKFEEFLK
jgi:hypothetical protein